MNIKRNPISARNMVFCFIITTLFKGRIVITSVRLSVCTSVCLLCYLFLNHWTKSNQVWCASYLYEWGVQQHFFGHPPLAPGRVQKSTIIFEKSISKIFYTKPFVYSHKWKKWDFHYVAWVIPQGVGLGVALGSKFYFFPNMVKWHIKLKGVVSRMGYKLDVHPMVKLVTLRWSQYVNFHLISSRAWGCLWWHPIDYAIMSTLIFLDVSKFEDCCSIAHLASLLHQ